MLLSFRIQSEFNQRLDAKEFHINLWFFGQESIYLDVGLWFEIELRTFLDNNVSFDLITPFLVDDEIKDLHEKMCNDSILRLLHNEEFKTSTGGIAPDLIHHLSFTDSGRGSFLILKSVLTKINESVIKIDLIKEGIDEQKLQNYNFIGEQDKIGVYTRFRYQVKSSNDSNLNLSSVVLHEKMLVDLRINDIRSDATPNPTAQIVNVNKMMFFVILPISYEITEGTQFRKYVRILEAKWKEYIEFNVEDKFLVHYWRRDDIGNDSYNLLISARKEIEELTFGKYQNILAFLSTRIDKVIQFFYLHILLTLFVFLLLIYDKLPSIISYFPFADYIINYALLVFKIVIGIVSVGFALIAGNALWDLIKFIVKKVQSRVKS